MTLLGVYVVPHTYTFIIFIIFISPSILFRVGSSLFFSSYPIYGYLIESYDIVTVIELAIFSTNPDGETALNTVRYVRQGDWMSG